MNDVGDHDAGRAADEHGREEIAEGKDEGEGSSGEQAGNGERKNDAEERGARTGAEVVGSFDEIARNVFEGSVERKKDERRVDVREQ